MKRGCMRRPMAILGMFALALAVAPAPRVAEAAGWLGPTPGPKSADYGKERQIVKTVEGNPSDGRESFPVAVVGLNRLWIDYDVEAPAGLGSFDEVLAFLGDFADGYSRLAGDDGWESEPLSEAVFDDMFKGRTVDEYAAWMETQADTSRVLDESDPCSKAVADYQRGWLAGDAAYRFLKEASAGGHGGELVASLLRSDEGLALADTEGLAAFHAAYVQGDAKDHGLGPVDVWGIYDVFGVSDSPEKTVAVTDVPVGQAVKVDTPHPFEEGRSFGEEIDRVGTQPVLVLECPFEGDDAYETFEPFVSGAPFTVSVPEGGSAVHVGYRAGAAVLEVVNRAVGHAESDTVPVEPAGPEPSSSSEPVVPVGPVEPEPTPSVEPVKPEPVEPVQPQGRSATVAASSAVASAPLARTGVSVGALAALAGLLAGIGVFLRRAR